MASSLVQGLPNGSWLDDHELWDQVSNIDPDDDDDPDQCELDDEGQLDPLSVDDQAPVGVEPALEIDGVS